MIQTWQWQPDQTNIPSIHYCGLHLQHHTHVNTRRLNQVLPSVPIFIPTSTWITAINNHQITGWSGLSATNIWQHLPISKATIQVHAKQPPQNWLPTTKPATRGKAFQVHTNSKGGNPDKSNTIFCRAAIGYNNKIIFINLARMLVWRQQIHICCLWQQSLFTHSNPYSACLERHISNCNFVYWTMRHQTPSRIPYPGIHQLPICSTKNIVSMLQNKQFRLSKITSSVAYT